MYKTLIPFAIGVRPASLEEAISLARDFDFQGLEFSVTEAADIADRDGTDQLTAMFEQAGIRPAGWGLPVDWRGSEENWRQDIERLPRLAKVAADLGASRTYTWIMPASDERDFDENYRFHLERFRPVAEILGEYGCDLGFEFIGPKTMRDSQRYSFIHTARGMLDFASEVGPNTGLLLDCWHWYTSHGTVEELESMRPEQVVYVHVNDAPAGIPVDEQIDSTRALPGETGIIDIAGFLGALRHIGYDGPVGCEPFKNELYDLPSDAQRLRTVSSSMDDVFANAGISPSVNT